MKKLIIASLALFFSTIAVSAQGIMVYKTDGSKYRVPYSEFDRIETFEAPELKGEIAEAVDLGLTSGTKWSSWNVGATAPEECGSYFAWGELLEKTTYNWGTYEYCDGTQNTCHDIGTDICGTQYDVARQLWGEEWSLPTRAQVEELESECTWTYTTLNDVVGWNVVGKNGNSIFIPLSGAYYPDAQAFLGSQAYFWTGTLYEKEGKNYYAWAIRLNTSGYYCSLGDLYMGYGIRPVKN